MQGKKHSKKSIAKMSASHIGKIPWNKGLTKETDKRVAKNGIATGNTKRGVHWKKDGRMITYQSTYSIPISKYKEILKRQNGVCAICGIKETRTHKGKIVRLSIDHNHQTGEIRGLLCHNCNVGIGHFDDNVKFLLKAINYLKGKTNGLRNLQPLQGKSYEQNCRFGRGYYQNNSV